MKIICINRYFYPDESATSQLLSDLAFYLARAGREVHVIASRQLYSNPSRQLPAEQLVQGVAIHRVATTQFGRSNLLGRACDYAGFYGAALGAVKGLCGAGDIVVANTDPPMLGVVLANTVAARGGRLVNWLQDVFPEVGERARIPALGGPAASALRFLRDRSLARSCVNVALGSHMAHHLISKCGLVKDCIRVIHNWADGTRITPIPPALNPLRRQWGLETKFVVGYSGNLGRVHEHETILGAIRSLRTHDDIRFLFIGGGTRLRHLRKIVEAEELQNVVFKPYQPREGLAQSLSAIDAHLCVLRPEFEGLVVPSKFYGIAAAGRPTVFVGDPDGEIPTIIRNADCGITLRSGDGEGLAKGLLDLATRGRAAARLGANARTLFETRYDQKHAFAHWNGLVQELA
jgi:colanic acid biosynthesis glycosyl transferase WcaI